MRWYAFPAFFAMYRFALIRAASRAMWRIWPCSRATRWIWTGNLVLGSPISNWLIRRPGTPPMNSFRVYACPRISRYMLAGLRVIAEPRRREGRYLTLRGAREDNLLSKGRAFGSGGPIQTSEVTIQLALSIVGLLGLGYAVAAVLYALGLVRRKPLFVGYGLALAGCLTLLTALAIFLSREPVGGVIALTQGEVVLVGLLSFLGGALAMLGATYVSMGRRQG